MSEQCPNCRIEQTRDAACHRIVHCPRHSEEAAKERNLFRLQLAHIAKALGRRSTMTADECERMYSDIESGIRAALSTPPAKGPENSGNIELSTWRWFRWRRR